MMKKILILMLTLATSTAAWSQEGPVAVDDYVFGLAGDTITVNVLENDYHTEGLHMKIAVARNCLSYTDSTITCLVGINDYIPWGEVFIEAPKYYILIDENGNAGINARGDVFVEHENHRFMNFLDINHIQAKIQPFGFHFATYSLSDSLQDGFEFPKGSGKSTMRNSGLWFGGVDEEGILHYVGDWTGNGDLWIQSGPLSVNGDVLSRNFSAFKKWNKVWKLTKEQVNYHIQHFTDIGYQPIEDIATWPAHGDIALHQAEELAPYVDVDGDGWYNPMNGDYPLLRGDQCGYFVINDFNTAALNSDYRIGLGLECHGMAYAFSDENSTAMNNTIFMSYQIYNRSDHIYDSTYVGFFTEFSIGNMIDDFLGCDVNRSAYFGYNGDDFDEDVYLENPPAQAVVLLGGPLMDGNGVDDTRGNCDESVNGVGFGDGIVDNERLGLSGFISFNTNDYYDSVNNQGTPFSNPATYNYLKSWWKDSTLIQYGGKGSPETGSYGPASKFMYPGTSDPCFYGTGGLPPNGSVNWTESTASNVPGNRMGVGSMGPFTFEPGTMERIDVAYVASFADPGETAVETLMRSVDEVRAKYLENPTFFGYQWLGAEEIQVPSQSNSLQIYPNPVKDRLIFSIKGSDVFGSYQINSLLGKVERSGLLANEASHVLDISKLKPGIYLLTIFSDKKRLTAKVVKK